MRFDHLKSIKLISECPVCHEKQADPKIQFLDEHPVGHLLYVQCQNCASRLVVLVSFAAEAVSLLGVLTDLAGEEIGKFSERGPISADDALELHDALRRKDFVKNI
ncbi:hypothetical protein HZB94_00590 [Candidatus Falkowbacteria bacterium]|nr:hypothetical protein [Candidatus Falkowbacteria bacterium]